MFSLFLGFSGFFLLVILLSIVLVSQFDEEKFYIDATNKENEDDDVIDASGKGLEATNENEPKFCGIVPRTRHFLCTFYHQLYRIIKMPAVLFFYFFHFSMEVNMNGDLISLVQWNKIDYEKNSGLYYNYRFGIHNT